MKAMQAVRWLALVALPLSSLGACAGMRVGHDYDPEVSFANLWTYDWLDSAEVSEQLAAISPFLERRIRRAVDVTLQDRGYDKLADEPVDFWITAFVVVPDQSSVARGRRVCGTTTFTVHIAFGYPWGYGLGYPWHRYRYPYFQYPWGYACAYRVGFGYLWLPVYERPGGRLPGTLVVDVFDSSTGELIWRGWGEGALSDPPSREAQQEYLNGVVLRILERFPPR